MTYEELLKELGLVRIELDDTRIDLNIERSKNEQLTKELAEANRNMRQAECDTMTVKTLTLEGEEDKFDPYESGVFNKDAWSKVR